MRSIAVLPMKRLDSAKQRLSESLGTGSRHALAQAMFSDVLAALRRVETLDALAVVTGDHEAEALLRGERVTVLPDPHDDGQSAAAAIGIEYACAQGFDRVLLVPGDTPLADPREIDALLARARAERIAVAIVPDRHGTGTNALLLSPPDALRPSFGGGSLERHVGAAQEAGIAHRVEHVASLMHDVDTPADLEALGPVLERSRGVGARTRGALRQLDRLRADGRGAAPRRTDSTPPLAEPEPRTGTVRVRRREDSPTEQGSDQSPAWA